MVWSRWETAVASICVTAMRSLPVETELVPQMGLPPGIGLALGIVLGTGLAASEEQAGKTCAI